MKDHINVTTPCQFTIYILFSLICIATETATRIIFWTFWLLSLSCMHSFFVIMWLQCSLTCLTLLELCALHGVQAIVLHAITEALSTRECGHMRLLTMHVYPCTYHAKWLW